MVYLMMGLFRVSYAKKLIVILALVCVILFSSLGYFYYGRRPQRNLVGVISVKGPLISSNNAAQITGVINQVISNSSVKAVVIRIDSPGGHTDLIEQIYLDILELKQEKPVVCSVVTALSGGYYLAVAADYIYAQPSSMIGNVGVVAFGPSTIFPSETVMETGRYKISGFSNLLFPFNLTHILDNFVSVVEAGRGERLKLSSTELKRAMVYFGSEAINVGLVDDVGSLQRASDFAAEKAGLVSYETVEFHAEKDVSSLSATFSNETHVEWEDITISKLNKLNPPPAIYYLYLPPNSLLKNLSLMGQTEENNDTHLDSIAKKRGSAVVDLSHGNRASMWVLDRLAAELAVRDVALGFSSTWEDVESVLSNASALVIAAPTETYTSDEMEKIQQFVRDGRILLLFFDPASEFLDVSTLLAPINSLANSFGLHFTKGYLYNEEEHFGFYRNIYIRKFSNNNLTRGLSNIVFFTASDLYSNDGVAWSSNDTYSSTAERVNNYTVMSSAKEGNGTVLAFGDITFLMEPYCYVEDNYQLILNIVSAITEIEVGFKEEPEYKITEPNLPVNTEKVFIEEVNGEKHEIRWVRVSTDETLVERQDRMTRYHYDGAGSLSHWESNGIEVTYDESIMDVHYPLVEGKEWEYESNYTITLDGEEGRGMLTGTASVVDFNNVESEEGESYHCAKIRSEERDEFTREGSKITIVTIGYSWISTEAGLVKGETVTSYYVEGVYVDQEDRKLLLKSIEKGET
jgi:protease-4